MVRVIGFLIGLGFALILLLAFISNLASYFTNPPTPLAADEFHKAPKELHLASDGPSATSTGSSCSADSKSIPRSARPATA